VRRVLKWLGIGLGGLIGLAIVAAVVLSLIGGARFSRTQVIEPETIPVPTDSAALARGQHLVHAVCTGCHGPDLTGQPMLENGLGTIHAANITGLGASWRDADFVRAIRHAVAPDGRELAIMPADATIYFSKEDLGAIIAYLKTVEHTGEDHPRPHLAFPGKVLYGAGMVPNLFQAELIDHQTPFPPMPEIGANVATGEYLSRLCYGCHGRNLAGGRSPDPDAPPVPGLSGLKAWSEADFKTFAQTGRTPAGRQINPEFMPWDFFGKLDPDELRGLYLYLHTRS
jgi:mono/diheme cytochrome c family protein